MTRTSLTMRRLRWTRGFLPDIALFTVTCPLNADGPLHGNVPDTGGGDNSASDVVASANFDIQVTPEPPASCCWPPGCWLWISGAPEAHRISTIPSVPEFQGWLGRFEPSQPWLVFAIRVVGRQYLSFPGSARTACHLAFCHSTARQEH